MDKILILGAGGQIGMQLAEALSQIYTPDHVIISDIKGPEYFENFPNAFIPIDVTQKDRLQNVIDEYGITQVYHLAALLSATAENHPARAWEVNIGSLLSLLDIAKTNTRLRIYWPSSIAIFGRTTQHQDTPQHTITEPTTVYGISKYAGELWCQYYREKHNVDIRSLRYPGIISWKTLPGGGTTDYAVDIYHAALERGEYSCYLSADRTLPMMYMDDAIAATIELMQADLADLSTSMAYNIAALSFSPAQIAESIQKEIPEFKITYEVDYRDEIAKTWPASIDDDLARSDWGWKPKTSLDEMTQLMLQHLEQKLVDG